MAENREFVCQMRQGGMSGARLRRVNGVSDVSDMDTPVHALGDFRINP